MGMVAVSGPMLSPLWYGVVHLRARLRPHVRVHRQRYRDQTWYQLSSPMSGRRHRINQAAYRFVGRLDGRRTVAEAWDELIETFGDAALTQDDAIRILGQLNAADLLQCELTPDIEKLFRLQRTRAHKKRWLELNPLAIRVRLFDPSRQLASFDPWLARLFSPAASVVWLAAVLPALLIVATHWSELRAYAASHIDTPRYLVIGWIAYPVLKALHELGHALAVRRWGGEVHDVGFTLFVLVPVPYVDASAANSFTRRSQRAVVSAIGIMLEMFIAALALYVWLNVQSGLVRDVAFVIMLIAAVSTVLFNGNPLLRFDGYHLLCDLLDLPNLDSRSRAWWRNLIQRRLFSFEAAPFELVSGERKWMMLYAPLAWSYRLYIGFLIVLWVAAKSTFAASIVAFAVIVMLVVVPCATLVRGVLRHPRETERRRAARIASAVCGAVVLAIALVPFPYGTVAPAVVWLPEHAQVRAKTEGFLRELRVRNGDRVERGQLLAVLDDPALLASQAEAGARLMALRVRQYHALQNDRTQAPSLSQAITHAEAELARVDERVAQLEIRSEVAGRMVFARQDDLPGAFLKKGQPLGYVLQADDIMVRATAAQKDAALIRERSRAATVWVAETPGASLTGKLSREVPAATFKLPSPALSDQNGGAILTDPSDPEHLRTLEPVLLIDVALPQNPVQRIGGRAWVRFDFGSEPLAFQWAQSLQQLLLRHFDTAV
jgi:putative peptide zinc metalloprotease protein